MRTMVEAESGEGDWIPQHAGPHNNQTKAYSHNYSKDLTFPLAAASQADVMQRNKQKLRLTLSGEETLKSKQQIKKSVNQS